MGGGEQDKNYKICNVLGGLDVTRYISRDARSFFAGAIDDVELIREVIGEVATNGGIGHRLSLTELERSLDVGGRGIDDETIINTIDAGLGYSDDRPDRRMEFYVSLNGTHGLSQHTSESRENVEAQLAMLQAASIIFPWVVDRKSKQNYWFETHINGWSEGADKEPFRFNALYTAAWIGGTRETWAYYPPFIKKSGGIPFTIGDALGPEIICDECPFVKPNTPENNPERKAFLTSPYPDVAQPGLSLISAIAPVYYNGTFLNKTYNDEYIASTGVDIEVEAVSTLLDVVKGRLTKGSFGLLVDLKLNVIVISQDVVEIIYPPLTGFEDKRVTYDTTDGSIIEDRRNQTYLVSDTIVQGLDKLTNADWDSLKTSLLDLERGERDYSELNITLTDKTNPIEYYVMYERWAYVADWAMLIFAPKAEVDNAINIGIRLQNNNNKQTTSSTNLTLEGEQGSILTGNTTIYNEGTIDVKLTPRGTPSWLEVISSIATGEQVLGAGQIIPLDFTVETNALDVGTTSSLLTFLVHDDSYPDCFHNEELSLHLTMHILPKDCVRITGDNLRVPDSSGACVCRDFTMQIGNGCVSYAIILILLMLPLLGVIFIFVRAYVEQKRRQADSVWTVKSSELIYGDPVEVAGRGTFGLVLIATYRGTTVAVKRVIPPKKVYTGMSSLQSSISIKSGISNHNVKEGGDGMNMVSKTPNTRRSSTLLVSITEYISSRRDSLFSSASSNVSDTKFDFDDNNERGGDGSLIRTTRQTRERQRRRSTLSYVSDDNSFSDVLANNGEGAHNDHEGKMVGMNIVDEEMADKQNDLDTSILSTSSSRDETMPLIINTNRRASLAKEKPKSAGYDSSGYDSFGGSSSIGTGQQSGKLNSTGSYSLVQLKEGFIEEMRQLSKLRHPCITTVMGAVISTREDPLLIMEYMDHGSLYDLLHNETMVFEGETILPILRDIAQGLRFLHSAEPQILHGDLKSANILIDSAFRAKVTDFGFSAKKKMNLASGTPYWMAPELLRHESSNTSASDVYSFGIVLYEVYSRKDPYEGEDYEIVLKEIKDPLFNKRPPVPPTMPTEVATLLYSTTLQYDSSVRPSFEELDSFLKRFQAKNVDPDKQSISRVPKRSSNSDRLLDEIFPPHVAMALREGRQVEPEHYECVTIFFSDIVGYTTLCSQMSPMKVSSMIDRLYQKLDLLSHKHGVYKLETIGDAWMGVSNLFEACPQDHAKRVALYSMDVIQAASETLVDIDDPSLGFVQIRAGFHSGPVLAGVVGSRLPKYTLFGDTVNTASRMESNSKAGRIHCSERSAKLLQDQAPGILTRCRGEIKVKGKGEMITYWVEG